MNQRRLNSMQCALLVALPAALACPPLLAAPSTPGAAVAAIFSRYDSTTTPGCSVAVVDHGKVVLKKSYGMADISLGVPMTSSHSMWVPYSEARVFVALAVAMLARDGRILLDDPVRKHVSDVPAYAGSVTLRNLLHHTSGLADYGVLAGPGFELGDRLSEDEFFRSLARWGRLGYQPGQGRMYSNTDYAMLKILVERVAGVSLHEFLEGRLFQPLGMASTHIGFNQADTRPQHALFQEKTDTGYRRLLRYRTSPVSGISVTTSLDDLIRWDAALRDPARGLSSMLAQVEAGAPPQEPGTTGQDFAFGVHRRTHRGLPLVAYHGVGEYVYLVQVPGQELSVATLCNAYAGMESFGPDVAQLYANSTATAAVAPGTPSVIPKPRAPLETPPSVLVRYPGAYRSADGKLVLDVGLIDGALAITPRGAGPNVPALKPVAEHEFEAMVSGLLHAFIFAPDGDGMNLAIREVASNEAAAPPLQRRADWKPDAAATRGYAGVYVGDDVEVTLHVRVEDGRVLMASRGFAESPLVPLETADRFRLPDLYSATFERDDSGRVIAIVLDATRVNGIRFTRR